MRFSALAQQRGLFELQAAQQFVDAVARLLQGGRGHVGIGGLRSLRLAQHFHPPGDGQPLVHHLAQQGPALLLQRVVCGELAQLRQHGLAGLGRGIALGDVRGVSGDAKALRAQLDLQGVGTDMGHVSQHLVGVGHPMGRLLRVIGQLPAHHRDAGHHHGGSDERRQNLRFEARAQQQWASPQTLLCQDDPFLHPTGRWR